MILLMPDNTPEFSRLRYLIADSILHGHKDLPDNLANIRDLLIGNKMEEAVIALERAEIECQKD